MKITVEVTPMELEEMSMEIEDLKFNIITDLDSCRDYSGYDVEIVCVDPDSKALTLSGIVEHIRFVNNL